MRIHIKIVGFWGLPSIDETICLGDDIKIKEVVEKLSYRSELFRRGMMRGHIVIMKNGISIDYLQGTDTVLEEGDSLLIIPMQFGG